MIDSILVGIDASKVALREEDDSYEAAIAKAIAEFEAAVAQGDVDCSVTMDAARASLTSYIDAILDN